ncbi:MAG: hypothetical protein JWQ45_516 [Blastococcus sp.]|nr:hypothetical protein [Blastococcus sp.]
MTDDRLQHLQDVGRLLWPDPLELRIGGRAPLDGAVHREYLLLPNGRRPRLLVPRGRRAATGALRGYGVGRGRSARWQAAGLALGMATGLAPLVLRDRLRLVGTGGTSIGGAASIESHLAEVLGREVLLSMYLGAPRANRKPVLQVLSPQGRTLAYVKVGVDPLTCRLVGDEAAALETLAAAGLRQSTVPAVLHSGRWNGLELLVQSPLPVGSSRGRPDRDRVVAAQVEVSEIGRTAEGPLAGTPFWAALTERIGGLPDTPAARTLADLRTGMEKRFGDVPLRLGAWHGDWTPWNTALAGDQLLVWDWERFAAPVPVGFDAVHWMLQTDLVNRLADPSESTRRSLASAPTVLEPFGMTTEQARATAVCYFAELATRYLADRQVEAGARLGDVGEWLLPAIGAALDGERDGRGTE